MKGSIAYYITQICLSLIFVSGTTCEVDLKDVESVCEYSKTLTLISMPGEQIVDAQNCNSEYNKQDWQKEPKVVFKDAKPDKSYTLLCIDPDPPGYQKGQFWLHWLVSNIQGEDFINGDLSKANHLTSYYGPAPPANSGLHRYMFVAFEEEKNNIELKNPKGRSKFLLDSWLQNNPKLCGPVAGVQFRTKY